MTDSQEEDTELVEFEKSPEKTPNTLLEEVGNRFARIPKWNLVVLPAILVIGVAAGAALALYTPIAASSTSYSAMHKSLSHDNSELRSQSDEDAKTIDADTVTIAKFDSEVSAQKMAEAKVVTSAAAVTAREVAVKAREDAATAAEAVVASNTFAGDGVFIVGVDIQPGQYRSTGGASCYWERSDAAGGIIDNYIGSGPAVVTVRAGDATLTTSRCAVFTKV